METQDARLETLAEVFGDGFGALVAEALDGGMKKIRVPARVELKIRLKDLMAEKAKVKKEIEKVKGRDKEKEERGLQAAEAGAPVAGEEEYLKAFLKDVSVSLMEEKDLAREKGELAEKMEQRLRVLETVGERLGEAVSGRRDAVVKARSALRDLACFRKALAAKKEEIESVGSANRELRSKMQELESVAKETLAQLQKEEASVGLEAGRAKAELAELAKAAQGLQHEREDLPAKKAELHKALKEIKLKLRAKGEEVRAIAEKLSQARDQTLGLRTQVNALHETAVFAREIVAAKFESDPQVLLPPSFFKTKVEYRETVMANFELEAKLEKLIAERDLLEKPPLCQADDLARELALLGQIEARLVRKRAAIDAIRAAKRAVEAEPVGDSFSEVSFD